MSTIDIIGCSIFSVLVIGFFCGMYIDQWLKDRRKRPPKIKERKQNIKIVYIKERDIKNFTVSDYYALRENTLFK